MSENRKLALGTAQFGLDYGVANRGRSPSYAEARKILKYCEFARINVVDTAIGYGRSENTLGNIGVENFKVVTKIPSVPHQGACISSLLEAQIQGSLRRLKVSKLYGLLVHRAEDLSGELGPQLAKAIQSLKSKGLVEKVGISIYDPGVLDHVTQIFAVDLVQAPLNLIDRRLEKSGWLAKLNQMGVEVHTRSAFLQGLLLMPRSEIPARFERWSYLWDVWAHRLMQSKISPLEACLGYPLSHPEVDRVVVGVDSLFQLQQVLQVASQHPRRESWDFMASDDEQLINPSRWAE